jgi:hypothetical protein
MGWKRTKITLRQWKINNSPTAIGTPRGLFMKTPEEIQRVNNSIHKKPRKNGRWVQVDFNSGSTYNGL